METTSKKQDLTRVAVYLTITFALTIGYCLVLLYPAIKGESLNGVPSLISQLMTVIVMFFPAVGVLLTRLITKEGFQNHWLKLNLRGNLKHYLLAWFGPGILTILGALVYFLLVPGSFDGNCGYMVTMMEASGASMEDIPIPLGLLMGLTLMQSLFLAPLLNFVPCFGEEWGWRGYLLPKLSKHLPTIPTMLLSGIIWGLWHAPLTIVGHNYGLNYPGFPYAGIAMMCLFCTTMGILLSYVSLKTKSCIPAILGHGAVNGIGAIGICFTADGGNPFLGPAPTGIIGMIPALALAVYLVIQLTKEETA